MEGSPNSGREQLIGSDYTDVGLHSECVCSSDFKAHTLFVTDLILSADASFVVYFFHCLLKAKLYFADPC